MPKGISLFRKKRRCHKGSIKGIVSVLVFLMILTGLISCSGKKNINVSLISSKAINLDESGDPLPVVVRIYFLKNKEKMEKEDFMSLWKSDTEILGEDIVSREEITVQPETMVKIKLESGKGAKYIGIMGLFRKPQKEEWKKIIPLKGIVSRSVEISVHEGSVNIVEKPHNTGEEKENKGGE